MDSQTDNLSGEQVVYAYDALNRMASASATNATWKEIRDSNPFLYQPPFSADHLRASCFKIMPSSSALMTLSLPGRTC